MYTVRILSLTERLELFICDMNCNRNMRTVLLHMRQLDISKIAELVDTTRDELFHRMITVDVEDKLRLGRDIVEWPYHDYVLWTNVQIMEGYITCPASLMDKYMSRMISDWGKGAFDLVINNINLKNKSFVEKYLAKLSDLEATTKIELLYIRNYKNKNEHTRDKTALTLSCINGDVNLAKWCLKSYST